MTLFKIDFENYQGRLFRITEGMVIKKQLNHNGSWQKIPLTVLLKKENRQVENQTRKSTF